MRLNENKKLVAILVVGVVSLSLIVTWLVITTQDSGTEEKVNPFSHLFTNLENREKIFIRGNAQLDALCAGPGRDGLSWETAYILENFKIVGNYSTEYMSGIYLEDIDRYLIIRNCVVQSYFFEGISIWDSNNINISGCGLFSCFDGMDIYNSSKIIIQACKFWDNARSDLHPLIFTNSQMLENEMLGNGLSINYLTPKGWGNNSIDAKNTVNGKPLLYYEQRQNLHLNHLVAAQLILFNCSDSFVTNFTFSSGCMGIWVVNCTNVSVCENLLTDSELNKIYLRDLRNCSIYNNLIQNASGIRLDYSKNNTIRSNNFSLLLDDGISLYMSNCNIIEQNIVLSTQYQHPSHPLVITPYVLHVEDCYDNVFYSNTFDSDIYIEGGNNTQADTTNLVRGRPLLYFERIFNLVIDGTAYGQVHLRNSSNIEIHSVHCWVTCTSCTNITIRDSSFQNREWVFLDHSLNCTVQDSVFSNSTNFYLDQVYLYYSPNCTIQDSVFTNGTNHVLGSSGMQFVRNTVSQGDLEISSSISCKISDNIFSFGGLSLDTCHASIIKQNIIDQAEDGIYMHCDNSTISNNTITRCSSYAIELHGGGNVITNNHFCSNNPGGASDIQVMGLNNTISNNIEEDNCPSGSVIPGFPFLYLAAFGFMGVILVGRRRMGSRRHAGRRANSAT